MNNFLFLTVKEKSSGKLGIVLDSSVDRVYVAFPTDSKWLEEDEITEPILQQGADIPCKENHMADKDAMKNRISMTLKDPVLQQGFEIICKENAELKRDTEDLIFIRNQNAKCMCEDKEHLNKARTIIKSLVDKLEDIAAYEGIDSFEPVKEAKQFLKESQR